MWPRAVDRASIHVDPHLIPRYYSHRLGAPRRISERYSPRFRRKGKRTAPLGEISTPRQSQKVRATSRYVQQVGGGYILDYEWPISGRSRFIGLFQVSGIHGVIIGFREQ